MDRIYSFKIEYLEQWISVVWPSSSSNFGRWTCEVAHSFHLCKSLKTSHIKNPLSSLPSQEGKRKKKTRRDIEIQHPYKEIRNGNLWHQVPSETMFTKRLVWLLVPPSFEKRDGQFSMVFVFASFVMDFWIQLLNCPFQYTCDHIWQVQKKGQLACLLACLLYL
jgi:hypothetical protein